MICELCGKQISEGKRINFMGAIMTVCNDCASAGNVISVVKSQTDKKSNKYKKEIQQEKNIIEFEIPNYELAENFGEKIRTARENANMKQEDLAKKINEPVSLIKRIEGGYEATKKIIEKIEKILHLKLIREISESELIQNLKSYSSGKKENVLTLGDVVKIKKKKL